MILHIHLKFIDRFVCFRVLPEISEMGIRVWQHLSSLGWFTALYFSLQSGGRAAFTQQQRAHRQESRVSILETLVGYRPGDQHW